MICADSGGDIILAPVGGKVDFLYRAPTSGAHYSRLSRSRFARYRPAIGAHTATSIDQTTRIASAMIQILTGGSVVLLRPRPHAPVAISMGGATRHVDCV